MQRFKSPYILLASQSDIKRFLNKHLVVGFTSMAEPPDTGSRLRVVAVLIMIPIGDLKSNHRGET